MRKGLNYLNNKNTPYIIVVCFLVFIAIACTVVLVDLSGTPIDLDSDILHTTITFMCSSDTTTLSTITVAETTTTETTTITTTTVTAATTTEPPVIETTVYTTMTESCAVSDQSASCRMVYDDVYKVFMHGTYYCGSSGTIGGSGRNLIDCSVGDGIIKGSVASYFLYTELGYNLNGNRTVIYLEIPEFPEMNGLYYVDDCSTSENVTVGNTTIDANETIDFFYTNANNCPFQNIGVVEVKCYLVNEEY